MIIIKHCSGGQVQFGTTGAANTVYATRFMACVSAFQDALYGKGMRVHSVTKQQKPEHERGARCTVCGKGEGVVRP